MENEQKDYHWERHPRAEQFIKDQLEGALENHSLLSSLQQDLYTGASTSLLQWVDHVALPTASNVEKQLDDLGFVPYETTPTYRAYEHPRAQLPHVVIYLASRERAVALKVESIADWLGVRGWKKEIEGASYGGYRRCLVETQNGVRLYVVERHGAQTMQPSVVDPGYYSKYFKAKELWSTRPRSWADEDAMMEQTLRVAEEMVTLVGTDVAAHLALEHERWYWMGRNAAGRLQKRRQDCFGMGWANHDHHTFRSSRKHFRNLVRVFQILGFHCRERFYAGAEAGWGAQVMENPRGRFVLFLDVDLSSEEMAGDFARDQLAECHHLGTIGLWCALHGDSLFQAGMHHLEAEFLFTELCEDLASQGVGMMAPFSDFDYLKQAFTEGERWQVDPIRVQKLVDLGLISQIQAEKFLTEGAIGSHLENLQRTEGFKGFNQKNVSYIIKKTDPRTIEV